MIEYVNRFVWGPVMLFFFWLVGAMFTIRTKVFQVTHFKLWMSKTFLACFDKSVRKTGDKASISQFQSLCTMLAATMGTGNIAGVATAITAGGPGAIFWMWVSAFFGMMTSFAENVLGIRYRYKDDKNRWCGGAMVYMERGLHCKWLAVIFSFFCLMASLGMGNMAQSNSMANALEGSFGVPSYITAAICTIMVSFVILGGIKRIARVTEKIVPFMAIGYLVAALSVIITHRHNIANVLLSIIGNAFRTKSAVGGITGYTVSLAMSKGISRGVFSNEAGLGSAVMLNSASDVKESVSQGMWGMFGVFADTIVMCTITALVILTSGVYNLGMRNTQQLDGVMLTAKAFGTVFGKYGEIFIAISVILFAFATIIGWSWCGERAFVYLFGDKRKDMYKMAFSLVAALGCIMSLEVVWDISDMFNGLMAIPNLIAITLLSGEVMEEFRKYKTGRS